MSGLVRVRRVLAGLLAMGVLSCLAAAEAGQAFPFDWSQLSSTEPKECADDCDGCRWLYDSSSFDLDAPPAGLSTREQALVRAIYAQYLASDVCTSDEVRLQPTAIGSKDDVGRLSDVLAGSFSGKGRQQKLVLFFAGHCGQLGFHAENWGQRLLILLEKGRVLSIFIDEQTSLLRKVDVDADGMDEIVAWGAWTGTGGSYAWVRLLTLAGGVRLNLGDFTELDVDSCAMDPETSRHESTVRYRFDPAAGSVCFFLQDREQACPAN